LKKGKIAIAQHTENISGLNLLWQEKHFSVFRKTSSTQERRKIVSCFQYYGKKDML